MFCKSLAAISIVIFLLVSVWGITLSAAPMGAHTDMTPCPLMGHTAAICSMNPLQHLSVLQNKFAAIPASNTLIVLLSLFALALFAGIRGIVPYLPALISHRQKIKTDTLVPIREFLRTLSLFEHSPTLA